MADSLPEWFGVRCAFEIDPDIGRDIEPKAYEERVTVWQAGGFDEAIELAEAEALLYASAVDAKYLGLAQAYKIDGLLTPGAEVFSLIRQSDLAPAAYLSAFFDTGRELQSPDVDGASRRPIA